MPRFAAISRDRHADKRWRRFTSYAFARQSALVPVVAAELAKASAAMPLAFIRQGEVFQLVALLGLAPGKNLFVGADGRWLGRYVPAALRGHPFGLGKGQDGGRLVLCVDEESELVGDDPDGEPFLTPDGQPAEAVSKIMDFLRQVEANRSPTAAASAALARHQLIRPWPIKLQGEGQARSLEGVYQTDEAALNRLPDEAFLELRRAGALPLAYSQLLSMQNLSILGELVKAQQDVRPSPLAGGFALQDEDMLRFD